MGKKRFGQKIADLKGWAEVKKQCEVDIAYEQLRRQKRNESKRKNKRLMGEKEVTRK